MIFVRRLLSVIYILLALFWMLFTYLGMQLISLGNGKVYQMLILGSVIIIFLVLGAVEAWRMRQHRSVIQNILMYGPAVTTLAYLGFLILSQP